MQRYPTMEVQILSRKFIKPSAPTPPHLHTTTISFIDQLAPPVYVGCILYYPIDDHYKGHQDKQARDHPIPDSINDNVIDTMSDQTSKIQKQLEKSLSEALTLFYPLAGRYVKDGLSIECNDEGVAYWEARANVELASVVHGRPPEPDEELLSRLVPLDVGSVGMSSTPLVAIQVNVFECGGVAVGVGISHKIADAFTFVAFIDAWAKLSRGGVGGEVVRPCFGLGSVVPPISSSELKSPTTPRINIAELVPRRFVFDGAAIKSLKAKAGGRPSRLVAVSALLWRALIAASQAKHGRLRASLLVHAVNLRGKTGLPNPETACGNFYTLATARFSPDEGKMELCDLADLVGDAIRNSTAVCANALPGSDGFYRGVMKSFGEPAEEWCNEEVDIYMFTSWCRFPFYEADFGWGKPSWVSNHMPVEVIALTDTKCGEGIEAWVGLDEQDWLHFQQDQDIVASLVSS